MHSVSLTYLSKIFLFIMLSYDRLDHEPDDFDGALRHCKHWTDHGAEIKEFLVGDDDWSLLLFVSDLNYLNTLPKRPFNHKIWLNAIWFQSKWYEIIRFHHNKSYREHIEDGDAVEIPQADLDHLSFEDTHFNDGDSLVYNPWHDKVFKRWKGYNGKFSYICVHRKEYKKLINVDVKCVDENMDPLPCFLWVEDKVGTWISDANGMYTFEKVELGTEFMLSAGFIPNGPDVVTKPVVVTDPTAAIEFQLKSNKVKVKFVVENAAGPVADANVVINTDPAVLTNAAGEIPPTDALPCSTDLAYKVDGPLAQNGLPIYQQVVGQYFVPKTTDPEVTVTITLVPVPIVRSLLILTNAFH